MLCSMSVLILRLRASGELLAVQTGRSNGLDAVCFTLSSEPSRVSSLAGRPGLSSSWAFWLHQAVQRLSKAQEA